MQLDFDKLDILKRLLVNNRTLMLIPKLFTVWSVIYYSSFEGEGMFVDFACEMLQELFVPEGNYGRVTSR